MHFIEGRILDALIGKVSDICREHFAELLALGALDNATIRIEVKPLPPKQPKHNIGAFIIQSTKPRTPRFVR